MTIASTAGVRALVAEEREHWRHCLTINRKTCSRCEAFRNTLADWARVSTRRGRPPKGVADAITGRIGAHFVEVLYMTFRFSVRDALKIAKETLHMERGTWPRRRSS
jgi:hypothetical protein